MNKSSKAIFPASDPTEQGVIWYYQSIGIGAVSLLKENNEGVVLVGQMVNNANLILTQALYIECSVLQKSILSVVY